MINTFSPFFATSTAVNYIIFGDVSSLIYSASLSMFCFLLHS